MAWRVPKVPQKSRHWSTLVTRHLLFIFSTTLSLSSQILVTALWKMSSFPLTLTTNHFSHCIHPCLRCETTNQVHFIHSLCKSDRHNNRKCCITLFLFCYAEKKIDITDCLHLKCAVLHPNCAKCSDWLGHFTASTMVHLWV